MSDFPDDDDQDGPTLGASEEMEAALREATESVESRRASSGAGSGSGGHSAGNSADKLTIEMLSTELRELKGLHDQKLKELEDQNEHFLRLQADFENFRRRSLKEKQESLRFGHQNLVKDLLSVVDNLERALEHGAQFAGSEVKGILDGVELVHREVLGALAKHGVKEIEAAGQIFDPAVHEAMGQLPSSDVPPNTILHVLQKGYVLHDRMLRPSRVMVAREPTPEEASAQAGK